MSRSSTPLPYVLLHEAIDDDIRRAVLAANPTQNHHFIAQAEQRQFAFNTEVNPQNQNVYRWPLRAYQLQSADSVNIEHSLGAHNLYTLCFIDNSAKQYNLESWFNRYESGLEAHIAQLRALAAPTVASDGIRAVLKLKLLSLLRNPYNRQHWFCRHLHRLYLPSDNTPATDFLTLIRQRPDVEHPLRKRQFGWHTGEYAPWLAALYGMMYDSDCAPSRFEHILAALLAPPDAITLRLYRYTHGQCLFADCGFAIQADTQHIRIAFGVAADMFLLLQIAQPHWQALANTAASTCPLPSQPTLTLIDNDHLQRQTYNRLCLAQARQAVYGKSAHADDYLL